MPSDCGSGSKVLPATCSRDCTVWVLAVIYYLSIGTLKESTKAHLLAQCVSQRTHFCWGSLWVWLKATSEMSLSVIPGALELISNPWIHEPQFVLFSWVRKEGSVLLPQQELNFLSPFIYAMVLFQELMMMMEVWNALLCGKGSSAGHTVQVRAGAQTQGKITPSLSSHLFSRGFACKGQALTFSSHSMPPQSCRAWCVYAWKRRDGCNRVCLHNGLAW